ncbi:hypothetical protein [Actinophytocola gossypii]|uniref:Uncharacterized protein n=1 Tax=Actinophytocola gossypii TaxID=2812003 RepID=A0ABT2JJH0_9PSEU|nr:hypothetical protein [Actinophytocola gossypii]MCT2588029.1 hypothetical protein [Actinophytocola gossypii]
MSSERMIRFHIALDKILQKSKEGQRSEVVFSLSITALQSAVDNEDVDSALGIFEDCADLYAAMEEPESWMGSRLGQLSGQLQKLVKTDDKTDDKTPDEVPSEMPSIML